MFEDWSFKKMLEIIEQKKQELESQIALEPKKTNLQLIAELEEYKQMQSNINKMMREQEKTL